MPEARSRQHYLLTWGEEIKRLNYLRWSANPEDSARIEAMQTELNQIAERNARTLKRPDVCLDCNEQPCGYRKECPSRAYLSGEKIR